MSDENTRIYFHPGRTLSEILGSFDMTQKELADRSGLSIKHINEIINEKSPITPETAVLFEYVFGTSASFWNNLQTSFDISNARTKLLEERNQEIQTVRTKYTFYSQLANWGYVEKTSDASVKHQNLLSFFGVASLESFEEMQAIHFRKSNANYSKEAISAWLRIGELEARKNNVVNEYDANKLKDSLSQLRKMTALRAEDYSEKLTSTLAECGVNLVFTPYIQKSYANGATRWINKDQPLIQISTRFNRNDILWFTVFHEIAHILKHGKTEKFVDIDNTTITTKESEADDFAKNTLIPKEKFNEFIRSNKTITKKKIVDFANSIDVSPDIVAGRMAKEELAITWPIFQQEFARSIKLQPSN